MQLNRRGFIFCSAAAMKICVAIFAAAMSASAFATDMDHKGRVIATVATKNAGTAEVTCNDSGGWKFAVSASDDAGRDVVTIRMSSPTNAQPPQFGVFFRVPGAGVQNVWTSDFESDGERIVAVYANDVCARAGVADRSVFIVNATGGRGALVEFAADARVEFFDVFGKPTGVTSVAKGVSRLDIPASGFAKIAW